MPPVKNSKNRAGQMFTAWTAERTGIKRGGREMSRKLPTEIAAALINTGDACLALWSRTWPLAIRFMIRL